MGGWQASRVCPPDPANPAIPLAWVPGQTVRVPQMNTMKKLIDGGLAPSPSVWPEHLWLLRLRLIPCSTPPRASSSRGVLQRCSTWPGTTPADLVQHGYWMCELLGNHSGGYVTSQVSVDQPQHRTHLVHGGRDGPRRDCQPVPLGGGTDEASDHRHLRRALAIGLATAPVAGATPIGGGAETGCSGEGLDVCDVKFSVTSVQQNVTCNDASLSPPRADEQWLRFNLEVTAVPPVLQFGFSLGLLRQAVERRRHRQRGHQDKTGPVRCVQQWSRPWPYARRSRPGTHATASIVVIAPKPATYLVLNNGDSQWKWDVR